MEDLKLGRFLKAAREKADFTQMEVAKRLGYTTSQFVSNWERGRSTPPLNTLRPLSKIYKISMDELFEHVFEASVYFTQQALRKEYSIMKKKCK